MSEIIGYGAAALLGMLIFWAFFALGLFIERRHLRRRIRKASKQQKPSP
jgi:uncharacterized protein YneF (UPF0154 family)